MIVCLQVMIYLKNSLIKEKSKRITDKYAILKISISKDNQIAVHFTRQSRLFILYFTHFIMENNALFPLLL